MRAFIPLLLVLLAGCDRQAPERPQPAPGAQQSSSGGIGGVNRGHAGFRVPADPLRTLDGQPASLRDFAGKPTLVNLWATWCVPCVKELPTLDALARREAGRLNVVAVSEDSDPSEKVAAFLKERGISALRPLHDPELGMMTALGESGLPTTFLFDAAGREVWRITGDRDWTDAESRKLVAETLAAR